MWSAKQDEVRKRRLATVGPVHDMVRVAPRLGPAASRERASAISEHERAPDPSRDHRGRATHVERLGAARRDDARDTRVASRRAVSGVMGPTSSSSERFPARPSSVSRSTVTRTWGRSPATSGRSERSSQLLQTATSASARRCDAVRSSSSPSAAHASCTQRMAVITVCPDSGSRSPSTRTMPLNRGETWRWRPSC